MALAGEWYRWYVGQHEDNPGSPERWKDLGERLAELMDRAHSVVVNKDDPDDDSKIQIDPKEWPDSRQWIAEDSGADRFLADRGLALTPEPYDRFLYRVAWEFIGAWQILKRRAQRDYSPDKRLEEFPKFIEASKPHKHTGLAA